MYVRFQQYNAADQGLDEFREFSAHGFNKIDAEQQLRPGDLFSESWTVWLHVGEVQVDKTLTNYLNWD